MSKNKKGILIGVVIFLLILVVIISYYFVVDRETKEPQEDKKICDIETRKFQDRKVFVVSPKDKVTDLTILYFHGGSYMAEANDYHWEFIQKIAADVNATVIMPDYPLSPKDNYKDVFDFVEPLYNKVLEKVDVSKLIVMGDSAGGGLALALEEKLSQEEVIMPKKTILISPWLDVRLENPRIDEVQEKDEQLNKDTLKLAGAVYSDNEDNYLVNPIDGDMSKLNNITIFTGTNDILNPDTHVLQERAKEQGLTIELKEYEDAGHIWMIEKTSSEELINNGYLDIIDIINN